MNLFFFLFHITASYAAASSQTFIVEGRPQGFATIAEQHLTISKSCYSQAGLGNCDAAKALAKVNLAQLPPETLGRNPGALLCSQQLHQTVVWGKDAAGRERTFCKFADGSYVGSGTLMYYGNRAARAKR